MIAIVDQLMYARMAIQAARDDSDAGVPLEARDAMVIADNYLRNAQEDILAKVRQD